ncbi:MAG: hypothetical protein ACYC1W_03170, partial [Gemmatimonadaceae bacterium]
VKGTWEAPTPASGKLVALQRVTQRTVADRLVLLAADKEAAPAVRAIVEFELVRLRDSAAAHATAATHDGAKAHGLAITQMIARYQDKGEVPAMTPALIAPPGDPFGDDWPSPGAP